MAKKGKAGKSSGGDQKAGPLEAIEKWDARLSMGERVFNVCAAIAIAIAGRWQQLPWALVIVAAIVTAVAIYGFLVIRHQGRSAPATTQGYSYKRLGVSAFAVVAGIIVMIVMMIYSGSGANATANNATQPRFYRGKQVATREELEAPRVSDRAVFLSDIPRVNGMVVGKHYDSCLIIGPGMLARGWYSLDDPQSGGPCVMLKCVFEAPDVDSYFLVVADDSVVPRGCVAFSGCSILNSTLIDIGMVGTAQARSDLIKNNPTVTVRAPLVPPKR